MLKNYFGDMWRPLHNVKHRENYAIERPGRLTFGKKYSAVNGFMLSLIPIHCVLQLLHAKAPRLHGP
jgi:hypothetical protein